MALVLNLKAVERLPGKADRMAKVTFRGHTYETKKVKGAKNAVYFGETFDWPVARNVEAEETLTIEIFNYNTYLTNKLIGSYTIVLQQVVQDGELSVCECLADSNNRLIDTTITFEVKYYSPDGKVGKWEEVEFQYPLIESWSRTQGEDEVDAASVSNLSERLRLDTQIEDARSMADTSSILSFGSATIGGEDTAAEQAALEAMFMAKQARHDMLDQELHKPRDFQVCITVVEAQQLSGLNIDPVIKIEVGADTKFTAIKQSNNCPYYNEYFVYDYRESPIMLFDKIITITAYDATRLPGRTVLKAGKILAGSIIGQFKCDVGTVYAAPDHQFFRRWAVLLDPSDIMEGPKGFVKCDISVIGRGDVVKTQKPDKDEDNIEGNLLLPAGVPMERQSAAYKVSIYRAEDLPRMDSGIMASVKKALTMSKSAFIDAYVKVSFVGHVGKTSVKKSYNPEWKEQLTFIDMFPPLCNRIKIQLFDEDALKDEAIATHFIELPQIMDPGGDTEGILPSFGPSWINFFGAPRNYKMMEYYTDLNEGLGEGCAYRGRLMVAVKTDLLDSEMTSASTVYKDKVRAAGKIEVAPRREFMVFSTIYDASMIDKEHKDKEVYFELSIGSYGNTLDAKGEMSIMSSDESGDSDDEDQGERTKLVKKGAAHEEEAETPSKSTTEPMVPQSDDRYYYYIPWKEEKPCLHVMARFEDLRKRLYHTNLIERIADSLDSALEDLRVTIMFERPHQRYKLKMALEEMVKGCDTYLRMATNLNVGAGSGKTKLDKHRLKSCKSHIEKLKKGARILMKGITRDNVRDRFKEAKDYLKRLRHFAKEPQHSLPDVFIWMIVGGKRVAYAKMPAKDLIAATQPELQGKECGKLQTIFLKKVGKDSQGAGGWAIQCKLLIYVWLGQRDAKRRSRDYLAGVPQGYVQTTEVKRADTAPPSNLVYRGEIEFQLRAYIYQGRSLIGSDSSGLSDPFARVIFWNQCKQSRIVEATLSPTWDQVLVFDKIIMHGDPNVIAASSPIVIIEIFDYDAVGEPEFLGRCMARPKVKMADEPYEAPNFPAPLQWWDVFRGSSKAGELLASFELLEGDDSEYLPLPAPVMKDKLPVIPLPQEIKPAVSRHRLEIMFWGVREPKRVQLLTVDRPRVEVEVAGVIKASKPLMNIQRNSNFEKPLEYVDLELPDNELYWPPLTIRVIDCRNFGREVLLGTATVTALPEYIYISPEEMWRRQEELRLRAERNEQNKTLNNSGGQLSNGGLLNGNASVIGSRLGNGSVAGNRSVAGSGALLAIPNGPSPPRSIIGSKAPSVISYQPQGLDPNVVVMQPSRAQSRMVSRAPSMMGSIGPPQAASSRPPSVMGVPVSTSSPSKAPSLLGVPASTSSPSRAPSRTGSTLGAKSLSHHSLPPGSIKNGAHPGDVIIQLDAQSGIVPQTQDQVVLTVDDLPLVGPPDGPTTTITTPQQIQVVAPDGTMLPPGVLGVGPDGKPLPEGVAPLGPDGKPLPDGVYACGPDGKHLPPGVLGIGPDSRPLPPGVHPIGADGKPLPTGSAQPGPGGTLPAQVPSPAKRAPPPKNRKELIAELDWWSKYHVTMEDIQKEEEKEKDEEEGGELTDDDILSGEEEAFKEEFRPMDYAGFDAEDIKNLKELAEAEDDDDDDEDDALTKRLKKKGKKKKKKKDKAAKKARKKAMKKAAKKRLADLKGKLNQAFSKDESDEEEELEPEPEEDKSHICRFKFYDNELEEVPDFDGFGDWVKTFHLYRGKKTDDEEDDMNRVVGSFKGNFCIYKITEDDEAENVTNTHSTLAPKLRLSERLPPTKPFEVLVRVYVIQCMELHPVDLNGKADPYLVIRCGRREKNDKENRINNTLTPVFGKMFELDVVFPMDSNLKIQVVDYDAFSSDDLIGETSIDLENRFFSKYRGGCGISDIYEIFGYNSWRDPMKPTHILAKICKDNKIEPPSYGRNGEVTICGRTYRAEKKIENEQGEHSLTDEHMALEVLEHLEEIPLGFSIVPEHVETRRLYNPERPGVEQGKIQMWVDLFPKDQPTPSTVVDITPRKPLQYELRCIIWNTDEVVLEDTNPLTGEASSDIFMKGYMLGMGEDDQSTDVHYRSLDGEGNFNWRYVFPFDYLKAEEKVVYKKKESIFSMDESEMKAPCKLTLQVWDADLVSADDFLGAVTLDLNRMPRPTKDSKNCTLKIIGPDAPKMNLFKQKRCKGWWPMYADESPESEESGPQLIGKVEAELHLVTIEEALKAPAGLGREQPDPLPEPNRPDSSFLWFMNPCKTLKFIIWKRYKWLIFKAILFTLFIAFLALLFYTAPGAITSKIFGVGS